jgi:hypothetical protein
LLAFAYDNLLTGFHFAEQLREIGLCLISAGGSEIRPYHVFYLGLCGRHSKEGEPRVRAFGAMPLEFGHFPRGLTLGIPWAD